MTTHLAAAPALADSQQKKTTSLAALVALDPIGSNVEIVFLMKIKLGLNWTTVGSKVEIIFMQKLRLGLKWKLIFKAAIGVGSKVEIISMQKLRLGPKGKADGSKVELSI